MNLPKFSADGNTLAVGSLIPGYGGIQTWHMPSFTEIAATEKSGLHNH
jgi:hypothetical protein